MYWLFVDPETREIIRDSVMYYSSNEDVSRPYPDWHGRQVMREPYG